MNNFWDGIANENIYRFVISGGPCGGKTSAIAFLKKRFEELGFKVLIVTEAATNFFATGMRPFRSKGTRGFSVVDLQREILSDTIRAESRVYKFAHLWYSYHKQKVIILCDRGILDGGAYVSPAIFGHILEDEGVSFQSVHSRYNGVFCLQTAAIDTDCYTKANNAERTETPGQAIYKDQRTYRAWRGAPHLTYLKNKGTTFEGKLAQLFDAMCQVIGFPHVIEREMKYLVKVNLRQLQKRVTKAKVAQRYLLSAAPGQERRVRKIFWSSDGSTSYFATIKRLSDDCRGRIETEAVIDKNQFGRLLRDADPALGWVRKERSFFPSGAGVFELDQFEDDEGSPIHEFLAQHGGDALMEYEFRFEGDNVPLTPRGVTIVRDVTDDPRFSNAGLARLCAA